AVDLDPARFPEGQQSSRSRGGQAARLLRAGRTTRCCRSVLHLAAGFSGGTADPRRTKGSGLRSLLVRRRTEPYRRLSGLTGALAGEDAPAAGTNGTQTAVPAPGAPTPLQGDG